MDHGQCVAPPFLIFLAVPYELTNDTTYETCRAVQCERVGPSE